MSFQRDLTAVGRFDAALAEPSLPPSSAAASMLARALDAIDRAILLLQGDGRVAFVNQVARRELADAHALRVVESRLRSRHAGDADALQDAIDDALTNGITRSLAVGRATDRPTKLSVVPVAAHAPDAPPGAMVVFDRRDDAREPGCGSCAHRPAPARSEHELMQMLVVSDDGAELGHAGATLSPRQREVFSRALRGKPNKIIARELGIAEGTVKVHLAMVFRALGVRNRTEAMYRVLSADTAAAVTRL